MSAAGSNPASSASRTTRTLNRECGRQGNGDESSSDRRHDVPLVARAGTPCGRPARGPAGPAVAPCRSRGCVGRSRGCDSAEPGRGRIDCSRPCRGDLVGGSAPRVLELSATGYRVVNLRGGGVPTAEWSDVESVHMQASTVRSSDRGGAGRRGYVARAAVVVGAAGDRGAAGDARAPQHGFRLPPAGRAALTALCARCGDKVWGRRLGDVEVSPSPVYGARLLSGLRVTPSRGFKSRHLRHLIGEHPARVAIRPTAPGADPRTGSDEWAGEE